MLQILFLGWYLCCLFVKILNFTLKVSGHIVDFTFLHWAEVFRVVSIRPISI